MKSRTPQQFRRSWATPHTRYSPRKTATGLQCSHPIWFSFFVLGPSKVRSSFGALPEQNNRMVGLAAPSIDPPTHPSDHPPLHPPIYSTTNPSIHPSIHPPRPFYKTAPPPPPPPLPPRPAASVHPPFLSFFHYSTVLKRRPFSSMPSSPNMSVDGTLTF